MTSPAGHWMGVLSVVVLAPRPSSQSRSDATSGVTCVAKRRCGLEGVTAGLTPLRPASLHRFGGFAPIC